MEEDEKIEDKEKERKKEENNTNFTTLGNKTKEGVQDKKKEKSKCNRGLKIFLLLIALIALVYIAIVIRNAYLLNKIMTKTAQYTNTKNFHYIINSDGRQREVYQKGEITKIIFNHENENIIIWKNTKTNEALIINVNEKKVAMPKAENVVGFDNMFNYYIEDTSYLKQIACTSLIYTAKLDGKECYVINQFNKTWLEMETGLCVRLNNGYSENEDGTKKAEIIQFSNWKIDSITDEDVAKPNLIGYTIVE